MTPGPRSLTVAARLPARFYNNSPTEWSRSRRPHASAASHFLEGPCFDPRGILWCTDLANGCLLRMADDGTLVPAFSYDGWPNAVKCGPDGLLYIADNRRGLLRFNSTTGELESLVSEIDGESLYGLNDIWIAKNGDVYMTDQGDSHIGAPFGRVLLYRREGPPVVVANGLPSPNGIVGAPDRGILFVAMTQANAIWRITLGRDGLGLKTGIAVTLPPALDGGPDGLAMDRWGRLWICHASTGRVLAYDNRGRCVAVFETAEGALPTNLVLGGGESVELFVTEAESGTIQTASSHDGVWAADEGIG